MSLMQAPIYIVDDEIKIVDILKTSLEMTGLNVYGFVSGEDFFNEVTSFDDNSVLILDLQMPIMDGIEVMRKLAKMDTQPAIILISGHDASVLRAAEKLCVAHDFKVLDCLSKPVSLDEVKYLILQNSLVNNHSESKRSKNNKLNIVPSELKYAIENNQFILYYQPQISISTNQFIGVEALIRWQHPERGLLMPDSFISIAEENGLIGDLTSYVISCVVKQEKIWQDLGVKISVSVNISADNITSLMLPEQLSELLKDNTIDPGRLILEVTESALMGELVTSLDILTRLRLKGLRLSIDDFGTGHSSLSQLHRVPFNELKIDQSFVFKLIKDEEAKAIVKTCVLLGHELNMKVVAEGVENEAALNVLRDMGCDVAQGYYIGRPMPAEKLKDWVEQR